MRKLGEADVVVANHSLYFADLAIIAEGEVTSAVLPEHRYAVFDEAHTIEDAARSHIGVRVSNFQLSYLLNGLFNAEKKSGFLSDFGSERARSACAEAGAAAEHFFAGVRTSAIAHSSQGELLWELGDNDTFDDVITPALSDLSSELREFRSAYDENDPGVSDMIAELDLRHDRVLSLNHHLTRFINREPDPNFVNWIEYGGGESGKIVSLHRNPIDISGYLRENLFGKKDSVVMTGATISISGGEDFSYFTDTVGLDDYRGVRLDSPFDFENRVVLHLGRTLPSPKSPGYAVKAMEKIKDLIPDCSGGVLLLFTSYRMMNDFSEELQPYIEKMGRTVFIQGQEKNRSVILREFQEAGNGVLFATSSFWMGVDVPGEALSNVFIMRLPFSVPNHPIIRGKCRLITEKGGNSFMDYTLPEAVLTFRQGVGRLLRNQNDRGTVAVFDSRIVNSRYGRYFLSSIPHCRREYF